jgi:hypothetical protein
VAQSWHRWYPCSKVWQFTPLYRGVPNWLILAQPGGTHTIACLAQPVGWLLHVLLASTVYHNASCKVGETGWIIGLIDAVLCRGVFTAGGMVGQAMSIWPNTQD